MSATLPMAIAKVQIMTSFEDAVLRLNSRNLPFLWKLCSYLSCIELFGREDSPIFPLWNCETERVLCDAVLSSKAASYKSASFTLDDLRYVINAAHAALDDPRLKLEVQSGGERSEMLYQLRRFIARTGNVQLRPQEPRLFMTAGRLLAMFSILPRESLDEFPAKHRALAQSMPDEVENALGGSIFDHFLIHRSLWSHYRAISRRAFTYLANDPPSRQAKLERPEECQVRFFNQLLTFFASIEDELQFSADRLKQITPSIVSADTVESYLSLFARRTLALRKLSREDAYNYGPVGWRLSPLERFPIVDLADGSRSFCAPNIRTFLNSFADVIHFTLQDALGVRRYNTFRGAAQEVFLHHLLRDKLSLRQLIPERPYKKALCEVRGPDLTLVEEPEPSLILVESKARRLLAETRFTMTDESVDRNFDDAYAALLKLPGKVADLRRGLPEYSDVQADLDVAMGSQPFAVVVLGEAAYMITELLRYRAENYANHPLHHYPFPFFVMAPHTFELAVEIASQEGRPLRDVLADFWEDSEHLEIADPMPESFRGKGLSEWTTFAAAFLKPLLRGAGLTVE